MQTSPLVLTIMAVVFLKERIGPPRIIAIFVGFIGVLIVIRPTLEGVDIFAVSALVGVIGLAGRDFSARILPNDISVIGLSFFGSLSVALAGVLLMVFSEGWVLPNIMQMMYCVGMIIAGGLGLWCMSSSIRLADVSAVSPFRYARIIFGMITGVVIFNENIDSVHIERQLDFEEFSKLKAGRDFFVSFCQPPILYHFKSFISCGWFVHSIGNCCTDCGCIF